MLTTRFIVLFNGVPNENCRWLNEMQTVKLTHGGQVVNIQYFCRKDAGSNLNTVDQPPHNFITKTTAQTFNK